MTKSYGSLVCCACSGLLVISCCEKAETRQPSRGDHSLVCATGDDASLTRAFRNSVGMDLIRVGQVYPSGVDLYVGMCEVTNEQYAAFVNASGHDPGTKGYVDVESAHPVEGGLAAERAARPRYPVRFVSWYDALAFCEWLSNRERKKYRLPSSDEWEAACDGLTTATAPGSSPGLLEYAWYRGNSDLEPHEVGTKLSNRAGCHDLLGNLGEWLENAPSGKLLNELLKKVPDAKPEEWALLRGCNYASGAADCSCRREWYSERWNRSQGVGFRVACEVGRESR
jgi:formylglycine-generating enzyme required for sulfatase activity